MGQTVTPLEHRLVLTAWNTGQSVRLRWGPTTVNAWRECNKSGYQVLRYTVARDGKVLSPEEVTRAVLLNNTPIRPLEPLAAWRPLAERDSFAAVAGEALWGESFEVDAEFKKENEGNTLLARLYEAQNRLGFALFAADHSWPAANALGLAYEDKSVRNNEMYVYKVAPAFQPKIPVDTGITSIDMRELYALPKPIDLKCRPGDKVAYLSWDAAIFSRFFVSYNIERSEDGLNWKRLNDFPFVTFQQEDNDGREPFIYIDSLPQNNRLYFYRISGNSSFDLESEPSDPVQGMGIDPVPYFFPEVESVTPADPQGFNLSWSFNPAEEDKISGYQVLRADNDKGPYTNVSGGKLLPPATRSFLDPNPLPINFYKIVALDAYKREMPSFAVMAELLDETPPAVPTKVRGRILNDGTVILSWEPNKERDLLGYRVFMANRAEDDFIQVTKDIRREAYYLDTTTLHTLSEKLYFRVMSEDLRHNQSGLSEIAELSRPDTLPPSRPVFDEVRSDADGVFLRWANSSSPDLSGQRLQRRAAGAAETAPWETVLSQRNTDPTVYSEYKDTSAEAGRRYYYRVEALDDAGLKTWSEQAEGGRIDDMVREPVSALDASPDRSERAVLLTWQYPRDLGIRTFEIYRAEKGKPLQFYANAPPRVMETSGKKRKTYVFAYADTEIKMNTAYQYQVRVRYQDGAFSPLSAPVDVNY